MREGNRAEFFESNPHSNGDLFSRSSLIFFGINVVDIIMTVDNKIEISNIYIYIYICLRSQFHE